MSKQIQFAQLSNARSSLSENASVEVHEDLLTKLGVKQLKGSWESGKSEIQNSGAPSSFCRMLTICIHLVGPLTFTSLSFALFRIFNILRGPEFLRTLHLAAVEAFADQALFPSSVLIHPTTLAAFTRIRTLIKFEVLPIMDRPEGAEIITQMKMMPTPSPAMKSKWLVAQLVR